LSRFVLYTETADTEAAQEEGQNQIEKEKLRRPTRYHQNIKEKAKFSRKDAAKTNSNDHDD
jgi:hypothetical protein